MTSKNFSQLKCMLLEVLNLKCVTGPMPLTSVYPPLSRKYQRNCDWKNNMCSDPTNLFREMFYCLFQSSTVSSSCHRSIDDEVAIRALKNPCTQPNSLFNCTLIGTLWRLIYKNKDKFPNIVHFKVSPHVLCSFFFNSIKHSNKQYNSFTSLSSCALLAASAACK